jgi:hypothetical protein
VATSNGSVTYHEVIRYRSAVEHKRQPARMTKNDLTLLAQAREFHVGEGDQPGRSEILTGDAADQYAPLKRWMGERFSEAFDLLFDQTAATFDRHAARRQRERAKRKPVYREIRIRLPE